VVQVLLQNGADATQMDKVGCDCGQTCCLINYTYFIFVYHIQHGMTAIHLAAKNGHTRVIEIVKEKVPLDFGSPKVRLYALWLNFR
jgi:ankyrin repeat protein